MEGPEKEYVEYLNRMNIHLLRNVARQVGVYKPTLGTKEDVIARTVDVLTGVVPPVAPSRRGAPLKSESVDPKYMEELASIRRRYEEAGRADDGFMKVGSGKKKDSFFEEPVVSGLLEILPNGSGYIRPRFYRCVESEDIFVSSALVRSAGLRAGDFIACHTESEEGNVRPRVKCVLSVNEIVDYRKRKEFSELSAAYPKRRFDLSAAADADLKLTDLFAPIGRGQRTLLCSPAREGRAYLSSLAAFFRSLERKDPLVKVISLLCGARPEDVGEFSERIGEAETASTVCGEAAKEQIRVAVLALERAERLAETGVDVVLLVDSLPSLAHACDRCVKDGKMLPCGVTAEAFDLPRRILSAARALKEGGSLTVVARAENRTDGLDTAVLREFSGLCNGVIALSEEGFVFSSSQTERAESLLNEEENAFVRYAEEELLSDGGETLRQMAKEEKAGVRWYEAANGK